MVIYRRAGPEEFGDQLVIGCERSFGSRVGNFRGNGGADCYHQGFSSEGIDSKAAKRPTIEPSAAATD